VIYRTFAFKQLQSKYSWCKVNEIHQASQGLGFQHINEPSWVELKNQQARPHNRLNQNGPESKWVKLLTNNSGPVSIKSTVS